MPKLIILGASNAVAGPGVENTHFLLIGDHKRVLVDCPVNPLPHLEEFGLDTHDLTDLVLTHFHPDHVGGVPTFLTGSWLLKRTAPLTIHGLANTIERLNNLMDAFEWKTWSNFYPLSHNILPEEELTPVLGEPGNRQLPPPE